MLAGKTATVLASLFLFLLGKRKAALLILTGFFFQLQLILYETFSDSLQVTALCMESMKTFDAFDRCQPLILRISILAAQASDYLIALGILLLAIKKRPFSKVEVTHGS